MGESLIPHKWLMRIAFVGTCLVMLFLQLLPLETTPRRWAGPDFLVVLTLAWAGRQPAYVPPLLVAAIFLLADFLLMRPPGLMAALMVLASEVLRNRALSLRDATYVAEWMTAAAMLIFIAVGYRLLLIIFMVERSSLGLTLMQAMMNIAVFPLVVALSKLIFGVGRARARDAGMGASS